MAFDAYETGVATAEPAELYLFEVGPRQWRFTCADDDIDFMGAMWSPVYLSRSGYSQGAEINRSDLTLSMAADNEVVASFIARPPESVMTLTVYRLHRADAANEAVVIWLGRVLNVSWAGHEASLRCEAIVSSMRRPGLRRRYQSGCPHQLYGGPCGVLRDNHRAAVLVSGINGRDVQVSGISTAPDGYFAGGFIQWLSATGATYYRMVLDHAGDVLTLEQVPPLLSVGSEVVAWPGCDHTLPTCDGRFSNVLNFGGFPAMPGRNPFATMVY